MEASLRDVALNPADIWSNA